MRQLRRMPSSLILIEHKSSFEKRKLSTALNLRVSTFDRLVAEGCWSLADNVPSAEREERFLRRSSICSFILVSIASTFVL